METQIEVRNIKGQFRDTRKNDKGEEIFTFIASTSDPDRHGSVLNQKNWKLDNFNANPIIGYQHNVYGDMCNAPDPDDVIGKGRGYTEGDELLVDVIFDEESELARKIKSKLKRGFLNMVSVGFAEIGTGHDGDKERGEDPNMFYFAGQELYELSIVNIPSNPKAKKKAFRSQSFDALRYIYRELGGNYRFADIEDMKVRDVIDLLDGKVRVELEEEKTDSTAPVIRKYKYEIIK